jgi:hypothetical protein
MAPRHAGVHDRIADVLRVLRCATPCTRAGDRADRIVPTRLIPAERTASDFLVRHSTGPPSPAGLLFSAGSSSAVRCARAAHQAQCAGAGPGAPGRRRPVNDAATVSRVRNERDPRKLRIECPVGPRLCEWLYGFCLVIRMFGLAFVESNATESASAEE